MSARRVECFFDVGSPASYLAWAVLPRIAAQTGAEIAWRPMLLGGVFKATGNASPMAVPAKGAWVARDLARSARRHGVPFEMNPHFPINTLALMRGAAGLQRRGPGALEAYLDAVFPAMWRDGRDLGEPAELAAVLAPLGLDAPAFAAMVADPSVKAALQATTEEAVARGVFGAPSMFVGDELFWGQDRLDLVREALEAAPQA